MKFTRNIIALIGFLMSSPAFAAEQTVTLSVPGMYCASCPFIVEAAMSEVEGVTSVIADSETRTALVVFDDEITSIKAITFASMNAGYEAVLLEGDS